MDFLRRLFKRSKAKVTCPRCLGKGHVDENDVKRLNRELRWGTGRCAYCNGSRSVDADMLNKVPVDLAYLTTDLSAPERRRIINNDSAAMQRAKDYDAQWNQFIDEIIHFYFSENLDAEQIAEHYLQPKPASGYESRQYLKAKEELMDYISKVITFKRNGH